MSRQVERAAVVVGRRTVRESCPDAPVRILMTAAREVRLRRRLQADGAGVSTRRYRARMHAREPVVPDDSSVYTMRLDTTDMSIAEVRDVVMAHVKERLA